MKRVVGSKRCHAEAAPAARWARMQGLLLQGLLMVSAALPAAPSFAQWQGQPRPLALRHDVFGRAPAVAAAAPVPGAPVGTGGAPVAPASEPQPSWRPALRAVVVAGARSLALVDDRMVELGDDVDGFRLQAVTENTAVFAKGRQRVTLLMADSRSPE